jgi:hypothetical protein
MEKVAQGTRKIYRKEEGENVKGLPFKSLLLISWYLLSPSDGHHFAFCSDRTHYGR